MVTLFMKKQQQKLKDNPFTSFLTCLPLFSYDFDGACIAGRPVS